MTRAINPDETNTETLREYALIALAQLGGAATKDQIVDRVGEMLKDKLTSADLRPVHYVRGLRTVYADKHTKIKWSVWPGKTKAALLHPIYRYGLIAYSKGVCTLTPKGLKHVGMLAENWLKAK